MGNSLNTASASAANIITSPTEEKKHKHSDMTGQPPPECPMHNKVPEQKPQKSECPVIDSNSDINPLNMVNKMKRQL